MSGPLKVKTLSSLDEFLQHAAQWNQLWESCEAYEATSRCESIALWVQTFGKLENFRAIVVESTDGAFVGGIAFSVKANLGLRKLTLTANEWNNCGELLISSNANTDEIIKLIVSELQQVGDVLELDLIQIDSKRWQALANCLTETQQSLEISRVKRVGVIDIGDDWNRYFQCLSGNHRSAVRRSEKKLHKNGTVQLLRLANPEGEALQTWMNQAFEIENRSWKAANGSSILAAGMEKYFIEEAIIASKAGMLELWFLMLDDAPIAFEYCHLVKGNCHSYKIGYDENFKKFGPGRLLRKMQLEHLMNQVEGGDTPTTTALDTMGLLCSTKAKWVTRDYRVGRMTASLSSKAKFLVRGKQKLRQIKNRIRVPEDEQAGIQLGGASFLSGDLPTSNSTPLSLG